MYKLNRDFLKKSIGCKGCKGNLAAPPVMKQLSQLILPLWITKKKQPNLSLIQGHPFPCG